jgi:hypothetical protein
MIQDASGKSPYAGIVNVLELIVPAVMDHYIAHVVEMRCTCYQCRRDAAAAALTWISPIYFGSLDEQVQLNPRLREGVVSLEALDQHVRRAIALISERPHHDRKGPPPGTPMTTPELLAKDVVRMIEGRPLLEQLYGIPLPMCVPCNEVGRRPQSRFCDRCGSPLVAGLPSTALVDRQG